MRGATLSLLVVLALGGIVRAEEEPAHRKGLDLTEETLERWDATTERSARNRYALLVGIEDYQDERIPDLRFCEDDAKQFHDLLVDPGHGLFDPKRMSLGEDRYVRMLLGREATTREVRKGLNWLARVAGPDDLVIVYFSGHGAKDFGETCWITWDSEVDDLASTALPGSEISYLLGKIQSRRLLVLVDCCHAADTVIGELRGTRSGFTDSEEMARSFTGEGRVTISAATGSQQAMEADDVGHGVFTHLLCQALAGQADVEEGGNRDGWTSLQEVLDYLQGRVQESAQARGHDQKIVWETRGASRLDLFLLTVDPDRRAEVRDQVRRKDEEGEINGLRRKLEELMLAGAVPTDVYTEFLGYFVRWRAEEPLGAREAARFQVLRELAGGAFPPKYLAPILEWVSKPRDVEPALSPEDRVRRAWQQAVDARAR